MEAATKSKKRSAKQPLAEKKNNNKPSSPVVAMKKATTRSTDKSATSKSAANKPVVRKTSTKPSAAATEESTMRDVLLSEEVFNKIPVVKPEKLTGNQAFSFNMRSLYPEKGTELCFEELRGRKIMEKKKREEELKKQEKLEEQVKLLTQQVELLLNMKQADHSKPTNVQLNSGNEQSKEVSAGDKSSGKSEFSVVRGFFNDTREATASEAAIKAKQASNKSNADPSKNSAYSLALQVFNDESTNDKTATSDVSKPSVHSAKKTESFNIFQDDTCPVVPLNSKKAAKVPFEIYTEETEAKVSSGKIASTDQISEQKTDDDDKYNFTACDYSVNPVGYMQYGRPSITFMVPSETEFALKSTVTSTPATHSNRKHVSRVKNSTANGAVPQNPTKVGALQPLVEKSQTQEAAGLTGKLSPINETSREYKSSSSSSSSSAAHTTHGTTSTFHQNQTSKRSRALSGNQEPIDPFDPIILAQLLSELAEPIEKRRGFFYVNRLLPKIKPSMTSLKLGGEQYLVTNLLATGAYARIYTAQINDLSTSVDDGATIGALSKLGHNKQYALKVCKTPTMWEFYVTNELHRRLTRTKCMIDIEVSVMESNPAVAYKDGVILVDELCQNGSMINVINVLKKRNQQFPKSVGAYFALELLLIMREIHSHEIIHGDMKPDNVLVLNL